MSPVSNHSIVLVNRNSIKNILNDSKNLHFDVHRGENGLDTEEN